MPFFFRRKTKTQRNINTNKPVRIKSEYVGFIDVPIDPTKETINYETDDFKRYFFLVNTIGMPVFTYNSNLIPIYVGYDNEKPYFYIDPILYNFFNELNMTKRNTSSMKHGIKRGFKIAAAIAPVAAIIPEPHVVSVVATVAGSAGIVGGIYKGYSKARSHKKARSNITSSRNSYNTEYKTSLIKWDYFIKNFKPFIKPKGINSGLITPSYLLRIKRGYINAPQIDLVKLNNNIFTNTTEGKHISNNDTINDVGFITRKDIKGFTVNLNNTIPKTIKEEEEYSI